MAIMLAINATIKVVSKAWDTLNTTVEKQQAKIDELNYMQKILYRLYFIYQNVTYRVFLLLQLLIFRKDVITML